MARVRFGLPRGMLQTALPGESAHLGIRHVVMNVREPLGLGVGGPNAARTAEIGNAGVSRDASARQRDDARGGIDPAAHDSDIIHRASLHRASLTLPDVSECPKSGHP